MNVIISYSTYVPLRKCSLIFYVMQMLLLALLVVQVSAALTVFFDIWNLA